MKALENWTRVNLSTFLKDISEDERRVIRNAAIGWMALDDFWKVVVRRGGNGNENGEGVVKVILKGLPDLKRFFIEQKMASIRWRA
jgi:hypothetical protein